MLSCSTMDKEADCMFNSMDSSNLNEYADDIDAMFDVCYYDWLIMRIIHHITYMAEYQDVLRRRFLMEVRRKWAELGGKYYDE